MFSQKCREQRETDRQRKPDIQTEKETARETERGAGFNVPLTA